MPHIQIQHVIVHTPEQTREIIEAALVIVGELELSDDLRRQAFEKACDLLGVRFTLAIPQQEVALDPRLLARPRH